MKQRGRTPLLGTQYVAAVAPVVRRILRKSFNYNGVIFLSAIKICINLGGQVITDLMHLQYGLVRSIVYIATWENILLKASPSSRV